MISLLLCPIIEFGRKDFIHPFEGLWGEVLWFEQLKRNKIPKWRKKN
jgi:hypothetical protein